MRKNLLTLIAIMVVVAIAIVGCSKSHLNDVEQNPPENKEQIRTEQEDPRDSVPPGHNPDNDDDDPYGGKYDPIWLH